jgi:hypothetical protein
VKLNNILKGYNMSYNDLREMIDALEQKNTELKKIAEMLYRATVTLLQETGLNDLNGFGYDGTDGQKIGRLATDKAREVLSEK